MAEITVHYYTFNEYKTDVNKVPSGKLSISPRGNGYEYTLIVNDGILIRKQYVSFKHEGFSIFTNSYYKGFYGFDGRLSATIIFPNGQNSPLLFKKDDAIRLYDFFADLIEWSPAALASGTAHPDLMAAQQRHSAVAATPSAGGGSSRSRKRKTRKTRKSRK
jgi:hypothetical protein